MGDEARLLVAFGLSLVAAASFTPVAIRLAGRFDFYDRPTGWKDHGVATPYLGGAAVVLGFVVGSAATALGGARLLPIVGCALLLWFVGTVDDRVGVGAVTRVAIELAAGIALWAGGLGWSVFDSGVANMVCSALWIVGVVNALNLLDLMDGVAGSVGAVSAAGAGLLAAVHGNVLLAALALSLSGACLGFLPYNLQRPSRIFLGDGGSMPVGFVIGASLMAAPAAREGAWPTLLTSALLFGLPLLDMGFRILSRRRRGISLLTGGPDSLANQLRARLPSARVVAAVLAFIQATLSLVALGAQEAGNAAIAVLWVAWFVLGTASVALLETRSWASATAMSGAEPVSPSTAPSAGRIVPAEAILIVFIAASFGISPFFFGYYGLSVWGPIGSALLAGLLGLVISRPATPSRLSLVATGAVVSLWLWALVSTTWAESADQAMLAANRWLLYATVFSILVLLLRSDFLCRVLLLACGAAIGLFAAYIVARLLLGTGADLFLEGRLNGPLGYVNGEAGYLLLGVWPCIAIAEVAKRRLAAAAGLGGAVLLVGLVILTATRSILPALVASFVVLMIVVPGRLRRAWVVLIIALAAALMLPLLLEVYDARGRAGGPSAETLRGAGLALVIGPLVAGSAWALAGSFVQGLRARSLGRGRPRLAVLGWAPVVLAVGAAAVAIASANPVDKVRDQYHAFVDLRVDEPAASRFTTAEGYRYDYWRVALLEFKDRPLAGSGAGNYSARYYKERRTREDIRQPHSLPLQTLAELGIVGGLILLVFIAAAAVGFVRRARLASKTQVQRGIAVAAGGLVMVWLIHTSVDWLHLIPGVTGIALCGVAVLVGPWRSGTSAPTSARRGAVLAVGLLVLVGGLTIGRLTLAERYETNARQALPERPAAALQYANESLALDREGMRTHYVKAAALARMNRYEAAKATLLEATAREPHNFVVWALLGDLATRRGDAGLAARYYRRAAQLNPRLESLQAFAPGGGSVKTR